MENVRININFGYDEAGAYISITVYCGNQIINSASMDVYKTELSIEDALNLSKELVEVNKITLPQL